MRRAVAAAVVVVAGAAVAGVFLLRSGAGDEASVPDFRHVIVVVFENKERPEVVGKAPTFDALARRYSSITDYRGVTHPSLPNYLALISGSTQGITSDCTSCAAPGASIADTLTEAGKTWKTYAEGLPEPGFEGATAGRYAKKHVPFLYFERIPAAERRKRIVPFDDFATDLAQGRLPDFSLVVPDLCNDMHDCSVATGDAWLKKFTDPLLASPELADSVVFVVFDEGHSDTGGGGRVPALALGPVVEPGATYSEVTGHYGLLRTFDDAWGLRHLGQADSAKPITGIWR